MLDGIWSSLITWEDVMVYHDDWWWVWWLLFSLSWLTVSYYDHETSCLFMSSVILFCMYSRGNVELREWGVFRFGNPTSGGTVFLHVQNVFPRFPLLMNFVSHCVSLASTCWRGQKHGPRVKAEHCRPTRTELTETEMNSLVNNLIKTCFLFLECNLKASPEVKVSGVTCWYELCGKLC